MDVVAAPAVKAEPPEASEPAADKTKKEAKKVSDAKAPKKQADKNVVAAILATVFIILGLAAMAVFAYLKQTGSI
jgi:hypothetical protein